ncbi:hypothetical protein ALC60_12740, partial [Trachymyrmex zeteki]
PCNCTEKRPPAAAAAVFSSSSLSSTFRRFSRVFLGATGDTFRLTVSAVASVRARRSRVRRTCDSVRGHSTTPWPPWVPEAAPADAAAMEEAAVTAAIVDEDDLHHHGN